MADEQKVVESEDKTTTLQGESKDTQTTESKDKSTQASEEKQADVLEGVEKGEDGQLTYRAGDSIYKGRDTNELLKNISKGITEKDSFIKQAKTKEKIRLPESVRKDEEPEINLRTEAEIASEVATKVFRAHGVDQTKLSWTNQQWKDHAANNGLDSWEIGEEREKIREATKEIRSEVRRIADDEARKFAIANVIDEEHESVVKLVAESGLPDEVIEGGFDYEEILDRVLADKSNYNRFGALKSSTITGEVNRVLRKLEREHRDKQKPGEESALRKKLEEDIARGDRTKEKVPSASSGGNHKEKQKVFDNFEDALEDVKKGIK